MAIGDALRSGLLVRGSLGFGFRFFLGGFLRFFALYLGVFGRVPGVENLVMMVAGVVSRSFTLMWRRRGNLMKGSIGTYIAVLCLFVIEFSAPHGYYRG